MPYRGICRRCHRSCSKRYRKCCPSMACSSEFHVTCSAGRVVNCPSEATATQSPSKPFSLLSSSDIILTRNQFERDTRDSNENGKPNSSIPNKLCRAPGQGYFRKDGVVIYMTACKSASCTKKTSCTPVAIPSGSTEILLPERSRSPAAFTGDEGTNREAHVRSWINSSNPAKVSFHHSTKQYDGRMYSYPLPDL